MLKIANFPEGTHCQAFMITHFNLVSAAFGKCCLLGLNFTAYSHSKIVSSENKDYDGIVVKSIHATIIFARKKNLLICHQIFFPEVKNLGYKIEQWKSKVILTIGLRGYGWRVVQLEVGVLIYPCVCWLFAHEFSLTLKQMAVGSFS